jgi:hypothetical protein
MLRSAKNDLVVFAAVGDSALQKPGRAAKITPLLAAKVKMENTFDFLGGKNRKK